VSEKNCMIAQHDFLDLPSFLFTIVHFAIKRAYVY